MANLQQKYRLPLKSLAYVNNHLQQLGKLSTVLDALGRNSINLGARLIPEHERQSLEHYFNQPFDEIYKHYSTNTCAYIDLLEQIYTHPAIANKEGLTSALQRIARLSSSENVFYKLLESKNLNNELLTSILYSPIKHSQLTDKLLSLPIELFSNELLSPLIGRCENEQQIQALINKKSLPLRAVHLLLNKNLKDTQILELLLQINDSKILEEIYQKFRTSKAVRQAIYAHPILTASCVLEIVKDNPCFAEDELISLLTNPKTPVDTKVLSAIVINTLYKAPILLAVAKHPQANAQTIEQILNHIQCTPQLILQILETKGPMLELDTYKAIAKKAYGYTVFANPHREGWENCLLHCLESIYTFKSKLNPGSFQESSQCLVFIYSLVNSFDLPEYPKFALKLLQLLKHNISYKLPFGNMITSANPEELKILVDYQFTGPLLNNHLEQLYERCTSPELIDLFIQRPDLNAAQSLKLLSKTNLSEAQLQTLITNSHHDIVLETAFVHPNATEAVRRSIYTHPYFSNKIFNFALSQKQSEEYVLNLLTHCKFTINQIVLQRISQLYPKSEKIQLALLNHPKTNQLLLLALLDSDFSSPGLIIKILEQTQVPIDSNLLLAMAKKAFSILPLSPQKEAWEDCLVELFHHAITLNAAGPMTELIQKSWLSPQLGLKVIRLFNPHQLKQINFNVAELVNLAGKEELRNIMLFTQDKSLPESELLALSKKCNSDELMNHFLTRTDLNESIYLSILGQEEIKGQHLLVLLQQANLSPLAFDTICMHAKLNKEVRSTLYVHPLNNSKSLLTILNSCPSIGAEEVHYMLNTFSGLMDAPILQCIANRFPNNAQIWRALFSHANTSKELIANLLNQPLCSISLLKTVLDQNERLLDDYKLMQAGQFLIERYPDAEEKSELEASLLIILARAKENDFSKTLVPLMKTLTPINHSFGLKILAVSGHDLLALLPRTAMIDAGENQEEIELLIKLPQLNKEELKKLSQKMLSSEQINQLLNRDDLTSEIADILLAKSEFKGAINHRSWVSPKHLHYILSHCQEFTSFTSALHHPQLSTQEREQWFHEALLQQTELESKATKTQNPKDKLLASLEKLKIKTFTHALKVKTEPRYTDCTKAAFELQRKLSAHAELIMMKRSPIIREMLNTINEASPTLATHRGYKQMILDILNLILTTLSFGLTSPNGDWRLFKAKTDSLTLIEEVKSCIEQFNPAQQMAFELN